MWGLTGLHAVVGAWLATTVPGPLLSADDVAYGAIGRALAGEGAASLGAQPPYGILYPVVLAPGWLLGLDEAGVLVWARVMNGILGAALIPILYHLVRRLTGVGPGTALVAALVGASLPAHMATASIMWTERLLPLLVAGTVLALERLVERVSPGRVLAVVGLAVGLFATHPRTGLAAVILVVAAAWVTRREPRLAASLAAVATAGFLFVTEIRGVVGGWAFDGDSLYDLGDLASRRGLDDIPDMAMRAGGTVAYLTLATAGLAVVGAVTLWRVRPIGPWVIAALAGIVAVAGWFLVGVDRFGDGIPRADAHLHGRYIEVFAPVLVAFGVAGLRRANRWVAIGALAGAPVVAGVWGAWAGAGDNWAKPRSPVMMLGVEAGGAPFGNDVFEPGAAASVAILVGVAFWLATRARRPNRRDRAFAAIGLVACGIGTASALESLDQLYDVAVAAQVETTFEELEVGEVAVDIGRVGPNVVAAIAWEIGFENVSTEVGPETTHRLTAPTTTPDLADPVAEVGGATLWELRSP